MPLSYKKLFHLLLDRDMKDSDLRRVADISAPTLIKIRNGQNINTDIICRICEALHCQPGDIVEFIEEKQ